MGKYNVTIGLEMHCEGDKTNSKVFSTSKNGYSEHPNVNICAIDLGLPGVLPVINKEAVKQSIMMSLALNCKQPEYMYFLRKNYYYPDLPKGYQLTQNPPYDCVGINGHLDIYRDDGSMFTVGIDNLHLEEDAARLEHLYDTTKIDYNRAGVPLFELVTTPSLHSAEDAVYFLEYVRLMYQYCGISSADPKKGQLRCDVNISISKDDTLGTRVEIKNVNSFRNVHDCIVAEIKRQSDLMDEGRYDEVVQETRRWDEESGTTIGMRLKVDAEDYKYFVEPNIPKFKLSKEWIEEIKNSIPELPYERKDKYMNEYGLSEHDASIIIKDVAVSDYFEKCISIGMDAKSAANWVTVQILGYLNKTFTNIKNMFLTPEMLKVIVDNISNGTISSKQAKDIFIKVLEENKTPDNFITKDNAQISDLGELEKIIDTIIGNNQAQVEQYINGKDKVFDFFVGQVMKETRGKANPTITKEILGQKLKR